MPTLAEIVTKVGAAVGAELKPSDYMGYVSKKLTLSSSLSKKRDGHGYHIELTDPSGEMLVFPIVTSSKYEASLGAEASEKRRYYLKLTAIVTRNNLKALVDRAIARHDESFKYSKAHYELEAGRLTANQSATIETFTHCTFQVRTTNQRQLELGTASDGQDFISLRQCLLPGDYLVFLQRDPGQYDVFGIPQEDIGEGEWAGWFAGEPGRKVLGGGNVVAMEAASQGQWGGDGSDLGSATEEKIAEVLRACELYGGRSIVALSGAPGTGKSYIASLAAARYAGDKSRVREIQFHSSFTYEEFVEGMRIGSDGSVVIEPGIFLRLNAQAWNDLSHRYVLLVEELTRANLGAVLGELLTYVEHRERDFYPLYTRSPLRIAPNLTVLATYNPVDRSAIEMDGALLRRLRIIEFPPSVGQLEDMLMRRGVRSVVIEKLKALFVACAAKDDSDLWMPFGHGMFADIKDDTPDLYELWHGRIKHLLRRPGLAPHKFTSVIEDHFPWTGKGYTIPTPSDTSPTVGAPNPEPEAGVVPANPAPAH